MKTKNDYLNLKNAGYLFYIFGILTVFSFFIASCGDDDPQLKGDNYPIDDIAGNWTATDALFSSLEMPYKGSLDVLEEGGTLTLSIQSNGRFTMTIMLPGEANQVFTGQLGFDEEWLAVSYDEEPGEYDYYYFDLNDSKTILTIRGDSTYDFDDDGVEDLAALSFILSRN